MNHDYRTIYFYLNSYKKYYIFIFITGLLVAFLESFNIAAILPFVGLFFGDTLGNINAGYLAPIVDRFLHILPFNDKILSACILLISAIVIKSIIKVFNVFLIANASGKILYDVKTKIMKKYSEAPYLYLLEQKQGMLIYYVMSIPYRIAAMLYNISQLCMEIFKITAVITLLFTVNMYISLTLLMLVIAFNHFIGYLSKKVSYILGKEQLEANTKQSNILNEFLTGMKHLRIYGAVKRWINLFNKHSKEYTNIYIKDVTWTAVPSEAIEVLTIVILFGTALFLKLYSPASAISHVSTISVFTMAILKLLPSIRNVGKNRMSMWGMLPDAKTIYNFLNFNLQYNWPGTKEFYEFNNSIAFKNVSFSYSDNSPILRNVNLVIEKNKINAIIGASGSGKTTIINLLLGLFKPTTGKVLVDGTALSDYNLESWFKKIAFVSQEPFVFHSTIAENISLMGQFDYNYKTIEQATKIAKAHDFIIQMPDGYLTLVGERGMKLSGGQQQRIAIARAVIRKPDILILDEATSALDSASEKAIQEAINNVSKFCTIIVIAHRFSTIKNADNIFVLKDGTIVEQGTHEKLVMNNGPYKELYEHQTL